MKADVIMVLEEGQVEEIGSHAELVEKNGVYRRIYDLQSGYTKSKSANTEATESEQALKMEGGASL